LQRAHDRFQHVLCDDSKSFIFTAIYPVYSGGNGLLRRILIKVKLIETPVSLKISDFLNETGEGVKGDSPLSY